MPLIVEESIGRIEILSDFPTQVTESEEFVKIL
jgi:hypothetical protein